MSKTKPLELSEDQVLFFRARRGHLAGPGAETAAEAARAIIGAQAQQLPPALLALSMRTKGRPSAEVLTKQIMQSPRKLVRTWGQRYTLHLYDPNPDWALTAAARPQWGTGNRPGPMPSKAAVDKARQLIRKADGPVGRSDLLPVVPAAYVRAISERAQQANMDPKRLAAARLIWSLSLNGELCCADQVGNEQLYAMRQAWHPRVKWPDELPEAKEAATDLARRYLGVYGPATVTDVAHHFGARVTEARHWIDAIKDDLVNVECGGRKGLIALEQDVKDLRATPRAGEKDWPVRLLPLWESMLMAHKDKTWTTPDEADRKAVWRKAAFVAAVVLARGRAVGIWTYQKKRNHLEVGVTPLSAWRKSIHAAAVKREAGAVARHFGLDEAKVTFA